MTAHRCDDRRSCARSSGLRTEGPSGDSLHELTIAGDFTPVNKARVRYPRLDAKCLTAQKRFSVTSPRAYTKAMPGNDQKPSGNVDSAVRERLLRAAVDSFAAFGYEGSSLRTIAQQAGVAFQLITYYFGSKEDLWMAAVDYLFASRIKSSQVALDADMDFPQQLRTWVHTAIALAIHEPQLRQIMCQEFLANSERYGKHIRVQAREHAGPLASFLDQAQRRGELTRFSSREMLLILRGLVVMATVSPDDIVSLIGGRIDNERTIDMLTDFACNVFLRGEGIPALKQIAAVAAS